MIFEETSVFCVEDCLDFLNFAKGIVPSKTSVGTIPFSVKSNHFLIDKIKKYICKKTNLPLENQEEILVTKYSSGGKYDDHYDSFITKKKSIFTQEFFDESMKKGGQRKYTFVFYLNDDFSGGETYFSKIDYKIIPKTGKVAYWKNTDSEGKTNELTLHRGSEVLSGEKWIVVVYVREDSFF